jgi:hypothetical protein
MTFPQIVFSFFLATLLASFLHLWKDGNLMRLLIFLVMSWLGFFGGHLIASALSINFLDVGNIHLGFGLLGCLLMLALAYWLTSGQVENQ